MPKGQSLADKLTALTNPTPEFGTQDDEDEDKLTGAKVTEADTPEALAEELVMYGFISAVCTPGWP